MCERMGKEMRTEWRKSGKHSQAGFIVAGCEMQECKWKQMCLFNIHTRRAILRLHTCTQTYCIYTISGDSLFFTECLFRIHLYVRAVLSQLNPPRSVNLLRQPGSDGTTISDSTRHPHCILLCITVVYVVYSAVVCRHMAIGGVAFAELYTFFTLVWGEGRT